jgi:phosphate ABC transporter permease protein PstC
MTTLTQPGPPSGVGPAPVLTAKPRRGEAVIKVILVAAASTSILVTAGILFAVVEPAIEFFSEVPLGEFLSTDTSTNGYGVFPLVMGTLLTTAIALMLAVPIGLGAAMYLSEYASTRARKWLKPTVELLAGVPSVVYGFFAVFFVIPVVLRDWLGLEVSAYNSLGAGIVLGVMIIPTVASLSEDALSAVPLALRQGSFAMGANRMQTTLRVVFPAALSGIAAAIVLGMSRAVGETMILLMAGGSIKNVSPDPREGHETMTGRIARTALGESPVDSTEYKYLFAVALFLFVITFVMNMISIAIVRRFRQAY